MKNMSFSFVDNLISKLQKNKEYIDNTVGTKNVELSAVKLKDGTAKIKINTSKSI